MRPYPQDFLELILPTGELSDWSRRRGTFDALTLLEPAPDPEETPIALGDADLETVDEDITVVEVRRTWSTGPASSTGG